MVCCMRGRKMIQIHRECWVVPLVSKEWSCPSSRAFSIVVRELSDRESTGPVVLLEITVNVEVLFQGWFTHSV